MENSSMSKDFKSGYVETVTNPVRSAIDKDGNSIRFDRATVPSEYHFRDAWSLSGTTITEDIDKAKELFKEKVREARQPLFLEEDAKFMVALENGDTSAQNTIKETKTKLRDATATDAIKNATNTTELKAAWDTNLLGTSPYK